MSIANEVYKKTPLGTVATFQACSAPFDIESFQVFVDELDAMEARGLIDITLRHKESQSGKSLVDLVRFTRLA